MKRLLAAFAALCAFGPAAATPPLLSVVYVHAGHLIEPTTGQVLDDQLIRVTDGRVSAVEPWRDPPQGAQVVDWSANGCCPA